MLPNPHVSFRAELPDDEEFPHPPGYGIARYLHLALEEAGLRPKRIENWRDGGWSIDCPINGKPLYLFFAHARDEERPWLLCCTSDLGLFAKFFRRENHSDQKRQLALAVHHALTADERFSDIRWYTGPHFGFAKDDPWTREPT
ncbi:MAG TPA: hypothetical protein VMY37_24130 [Thermoguttaceae bacterium]|nr:hypothetical protein [Thermoguttaceae bacterium]